MHQCGFCGNVIKMRIDSFGNKIINKKFCSKKCWYAFQSIGKNCAVISRLGYSGRKQ